MHGKYWQRRIGSGYPGSPGSGHSRADRSRGGPFVVAFDRARQLSARRNADYPRVSSDSNFVAARGTSRDYRPESQSRADRASEREHVRRRDRQSDPTEIASMAAADALLLGRSCLLGGPATHSHQTGPRLRESDQRGPRLLQQHLHHTVPRLVEPHGSER